ncbi:bet1-like SNARE 1-1 isoform X2 [Musa acuminata AAA Group]|uniref:bet1-like SNARE 1-1 isoform X2 n=1 Tax=Musa acuminata AAA Group TaxID=214697 RepID=UPI0031DC0706
MNSRRDYHSNRTALFDSIEEGGVRASAYSSHEIDEHDNDLAMEGLQDRVNILKRGNDMDSSRGILSGTMDRFKMVFETKSSRRMATLVASFVALFLLVYFLTKWVAPELSGQLLPVGLLNLVIQQWCFNKP